MAADSRRTPNESVQRGDHDSGRVSPGSAEDRIIVALDAMSESDAIRIARELSSLVWGFKLNDLLLRSEISVVSRLKSYGRVFCDPKLHDIPNTVANSVRALSQAGADLITLHTSGGVEMMSAAVAAAQGETRLLGVTVLTAHSDTVPRRIYGTGTQELLQRLAQAALDAEMGGIVCAPSDLNVIAQIDPHHRLLRVTPGIRPAWYSKADDQQRIASPAQAVQDGADLLVIGRPITAADSPRVACEAIVQELS